MSLKHLMRRMHEVDSRLSKCVTVEIKWEFTPDHRQQRIDVAEKLLRRYRIDGVPFLDRTIYLDSKLFYVVPKNLKVWGHRGERPSKADIVIEDPRVHNQNPIKLNLYVAVCSSGPVYAQLVTGTSGQDEGYMVSGMLLLSGGRVPTKLPIQGGPPVAAAIPNHALAAPCSQACMHHGSFQLSLEALSIIVVQPCNMEA